MPQIIACPQCAMQLRVPDTFAPGSMVRCPKCSTTFPVPAAGAAGPGEFTAAAPPPSAPPPPAWQGDQPRDPFSRPGGLLEFSGAYSISLGDYFRFAMEHYTAVVLPMIGYLFILAVAYVTSACVGIVPCLGALVQLGFNLCAAFALQAGIPLVCLLQMQGKPWTFADFFGGFRYWVPLFLNNLLILGLTLLCLAPGYICFIILIVVAQINAAQSAAVSGGGRPPPPPEFALIVIGVGLILLGLIPLIYFHIRCFLFAPYLIMDRNAGPVEAVKANWSLTRGHFWGWLGVMIVLALIAVPSIGVMVLFIVLGINFTNVILVVVGALLYLITLLFLLPFSALVMTGGYLRVTASPATTGPL